MFVIFPGKSGIVSYSNICGHAADHICIPADRFPPLQAHNYTKCSQRCYFSGNSHLVQRT